MAWALCINKSTTYFPARVSLKLTTPFNPQRTSPDTQRKEASDESSMTPNNTEVAATIVSLPPLLI